MARQLKPSPHATGATPDDGSDPGTVIAVEAVEKSYDAVRALAGVSFAVRRGEVFGVLGPNGAGKTTTVEILEGYRRPDSGHVRVLGLDPVAHADRLHARIGVMLQEGGLTPGLRPLEQVRLFAAYYDDPEDPLDLITRVGLVDAQRTFVRRLSGGQRQRLSLACALVGRPEVLFLDEPTAGMDPKARATTWDLVRSQRALGRTVVLTTHLMDEAEALCDRVAILSGGDLVALGTPSELTHRARSEHVSFTASLDLPIRDLAAHLGLAPDAVTQTRPGEYRVHAGASPALVAELACWLRDRDIVIGTLQANRRSLEEVFLALTAEREDVG